MRCGISSASFFPLDSLSSLEILVEAKVPVAELFLNTFSELEESYIDKVEKIINGGETELVSFHPFTGPLEGFFFAIDYPGRMQDGLKLYRRYFEICQRLGIGKFVFHGDYETNAPLFSMRQYTEKILQLVEEARKYGVTLCHENVAYCRLNSPDIIRQYSSAMGEEAAFVMDLKQMRRNGENGYTEMLAAMGTALKHVHISDFKDGSVCLPPGSGDMNFAEFIGQLKKAGYNGDLIIELYSDNYSTTEELIKAMKHIQALI